MPKKIFYIILIATVCIILIGLSFWYFMSKKPENKPGPTSGVGFTVPGQNFAKANWQVVSDGPAVSLHQNNGAILFYDFSGQLWQLNWDELKPVLLDQAAIEKIAEVIWSTNSKNIVKSGAGQIDSFYTISDPDQKSLFNLKADTKSAAFSPDGRKIIYYLSSSSNNSLLSSDSGGKNQKTLIRDLKLRDVILSWPSANNIAMVSRPSGVTAGSLWFLDARNMNISKIIDNLFGLEALFSPNGNSFIYSFTDQNGRNPRLAVYDKGGSKIINNVSTLVDKCVWAKNSMNVYCAIPKSWPDFAILPDDYYKNAFLTGDDIWKINTETGEKTLIAEDVGDISNLAVSDDENSFLFISKENQFLYKFSIR